MKLLADENIDAPIVHWLRSQGHDVMWVAEQTPGTSDEAVIQLASREGRFFITRDLDFGEMVFRGAVRVAGLALYGCPVAPWRLVSNCFRTAGRKLKRRSMAIFSWRLSVEPEFDPCHEKVR